MICKQQNIFTEGLSKLKTIRLKIKVYKSYITLHCCIIWCSSLPTKPFKGFYEKLNRTQTLIKISFQSTHQWRPQEEDQPDQCIGTAGRPCKLDR